MWKRIQNTLNYRTYIHNCNQQRKTQLPNSTLKLEGKAKAYDLNMVSLCDETSPYPITA